MESSPKIGCIISNQKDPYQFQCVFSTDPDDKRDFSVYFHSSGGRQELMASCTHKEEYECIFAYEGLSLTDDPYITVSEKFPKQNGNFVCRNGGLPLDQLSCLYPGDSTKPTENADKPQFHLRSDDSGNEDPNLGLIIGSVIGAVFIILAIIFISILYRRYKHKKSPHCPEKANMKEKDASKIKENEPFLGNEDDTVSTKKKSQVHESNEKNVRKKGSEKKREETESDNKNCDEGFGEKPSDEESEEENKDGDFDENNSDAGFEGNLKPI